MNRSRLVHTAILAGYLRLPWVDKAAQLARGMGYVYDAFMTSSDVAIIGAGPIGIELAVAFKRHGIDYLHFDAKQIGYTVSWFAPGTHFFSSNERIAIAGVPLQSPDQSKSTREQYLAYLRGIVQQFDLPIRTYEPVTNIARDEDGFILHTAPATGAKQYRVKRVVLATGGTAVPRKLGIAGETLGHVSSYFQDPHLYFRKKLLVIGGRNSAVETALRCHHAGARVALSYRREALPASSIKYWLLPEIQGLIRTGELPAYFDTRPVEIRSDSVVLQRADGSTMEVPADFVLLMIGYEADMSLCRMAGVQLDGEADAPIFDEATMQTCVPGIYVCGTVVGGTQEKYRVFIENCHIHVDRIVASLRGQAAPAAPAPFAAPES